MTTGATKRIVVVRLVAPVTPLCFQEFIAQASQQDVLGGRVRGMEFEAIALEPLCFEGVLKIRIELIKLRGDWVAEDRQAPSVVPK